MLKEIIKSMLWKFRGLPDNTELDDSDIVIIGQALRKIKAEVKKVLPLKIKSVLGIDGSRMESYDTEKMEIYADAFDECLTQITEAIDRME